MVSVDVEHHVYLLTNVFMGCVKVKVAASPELPVPNSPYGLCGRPGLPVPNSPYGLCGRPELLSLIHI